MTEPGQIVYYSVKNQIHKNEVGFIVDKSMERAVMGFIPVDDRICAI